VVNFSSFVILRLEGRGAEETEKTGITPNEKGQWTRKKRVVAIFIFGGNEDKKTSFP